MTDESSDESSDFGDDDDDSDDDYEEGGLKPWQKKDRATKGTSSRLDMDEESEDEMDIDEDERGQRRKSSAAAELVSTPDLPAALEDFKKVTIPRRRLTRWCNEPFFEEAVVHHFVRLFIGEDPDTGEKAYRLCEIMGVKQGKKRYNLPKTQEHDRPVSTQQLLTLRFAGNERDFPMNLVSDTPVDELDVIKYSNAQRNLRKPVLTKRRATKLSRMLHTLINNYTYTKEDIEANLQKRKKQGKSLANLGSEQTKIAIAVQAARDALFEANRKLKELQKEQLESGDNHDTSVLDKAVEEAQKDVEENEKALKEVEEEEKKLKDTVAERKRRLANRKKDQNWAKVNERALQANQRADLDANKQKENSSLTASGTKKAEFNPYARRKVKPKILWEVGQDKDEQGNDVEPKGEEKKESKEDSPKDEPVEAPNLVFEGSDQAAALSERHQFDVDEEGLAQSSGGLGLADLLGIRKATPKQQRVRKGISLTDYLAQKASGGL